MKKKLLPFLILLIVICSAGSKNSIKSIYAYKVNEGITLDGVLQEAIWKELPTKEFTQLDPNEGQPASEESRVWIAYDEKYIYIAAHLSEKNCDLIDKSLLRRDSDLPTDYLEVLLDPYNDKKSGYYFCINPAGSKRDGILYNDSWRDSDWDGIWDAKTNCDETGWSCEIRIPFSQLRFSESDIMTWGINLHRKIKHKNEDSYYVMIPKKESGFVSRFAELSGINGIKPKQRFEALPYVVQKAQYLIHDSKDPFFKGNQYKTSVGADFKLGIGSNLNLDMTINPDFGQVEVDPAEVNLSAFETYYSEKRAFFIEGANIFSFGVGGANNNWGFNFGIPELFYSRRIGRSPQGSLSHEGFEDKPGETNIIGAAKLTGKVGNGINIGVLSAITERTFGKVDSSSVRFEEEIEPLTHYGVVRLQKPFNEGNQGLGMMFTTVNRDLRTSGLKDLLMKEAYTAGIDGWTFLDKEQEYVLTGFLIGSYASGNKNSLIKLQQKSYRYFQSPDAVHYRLDSNLTSMNGWFGRLMLNKQKGNFYLNAAIGAISPTFEYNDIGSQWLADRINGHIVLGYKWTEPEGIFRKKNIYLAYNINREFDGNLLRTGFYLTGGATFTNYYTFNFQGGYNFEGTSRTTTRGGPIVILPASYFFNISFSNDSRSNIWIASGISGDGNQIGSNSISGFIDMDWRPSTSLTISVGPSIRKDFVKNQWINSFDDKEYQQTYGKRYIFGEMNQTTLSANIRINYSFTPEISLQMYIQPYFSVGDYEDFNYLEKSRSANYLKFAENGSKIEQNGNKYKISTVGNNTKNFEFDNPDFNYKSFKANAVLRWEVKAGSILYLVWTHDQVNEYDPGNFEFGKDFKNLMTSQSNNVYMLKFSYWLDI